MATSPRPGSDCRAVRRLLPGLQGPAAELTAADDRRVRDHAAGCPGCAAELRRTLAAGAAVAALAAAAVPPAGPPDPGRLVAGLAGRRAWWPAAGLALATVVGLVGWAAWPRPAAADYWVGVVAERADDRPGYVVLRVVGAPAAAAGLRPGDQITAAGGRPVPPDPAPIRLLPPGFRPGDRVTLAVVRDGLPLTLTVRPEPRPPAPSTAVP